MEGEQIHQVAIGRRGDHLIDAVVFLVTRQGFDLAQTGDVAEQLGDAVGLCRVGHRTNVDFQLALAVGTRCADGHWRGAGHRRRCCHGCSCGRSGRRCRCGSSRGGGLPVGQCVDALDQRGGLRRIHRASLMTGQQDFQRVGRFQQHVDHGGRRLQLMTAQLVQQRLHLVGQFGHVGKAESGRTALDRVGASEDGVELFVVGRLHIERQQHLLHLFQVFTSFLKEDLVELGQVNVAAQGLSFIHHFTHG